MITHDEARALVNWLKGSKLFDYITQQEQFSKDVARYFKLFCMKNITIEEINEEIKLREKLEKKLKEELEC